MVNTELKKCPVCGDIPEREVKSHPPFVFDLYYYVRCSNPNCDEQTPYFETEQEAVECWNNRAEEGEGGW